MKLMKKLAIISMAIMMTFAITACGGNEELAEHAGNWESTKIEMEGFDMSGLMEITLTLEDNGSGVISMDGEAYDLDWGMSSGKVMIDQAGDEFVGEVDGDTMILDMGDEIIVTLVKM